jgi:predicted transcriptional regulator
VPHGLRKNAVNTLIEAGCTVGEVSAITGQTLAMVEHYAKQRNNLKLAKRAMGKWEAQ